MRGSNMNPIDLDEPEETLDIEAIKEQKRNRQIIEEAKLSKTPLYLCLAAIKTTIKGDIRHKNMTLNRAIIKYFEAKAGINISNQHFHPRPDPDYFDDNTINPLEFLVYGVDFLTTSQIKDRFNIFQPQMHELMWINSSTCKIKYKTESQARTILQSVVADPKVLSTKINENQDQYPQGWFTMNSYQIYYFERQLLIRYSTQKENDIEKQSLQKFQNFQHAQEELLRHLLQHFNAQQAFQDVIRQVERERNDATNRHRYYNMQRLNHHRHRSRTRERERMNSREPSNRPFYRRDNRLRRPYQPQQIRLREVREVQYEHQPTSMRRRNQDEYPRRLKAPARGNVYYDCNDIDYDPSNLSFDFHEQEHESDRDDLQQIDLSMGFKDKPQKPRKDADLSIMNASKQKVEKSSSNPDLSFVFNSSKVENKQDLSILFNNSRTDNNLAHKNGLSILLNNSRVDNHHVPNNDLSIILNNSIAQNNLPSNNDLSILLNNSRVQQSDPNNHDLSLIFNHSKGDNKDNSRNADTSLLMAEQPDKVNVLDTSVKIERNKQTSSAESNVLDTSLKFEPKNEAGSIDNQEEDYGAFLGFNVDQISPIHPNILDSSFQFEQKGNEKGESKGQREKEIDYLDFKRAEKKRKRETRIILDSDDSGY